MGKKWSKKRAEAWGRQFIEETEVVPSSSLRRNFDGPDDQELIRLYGGVKNALEAWGAPLAEATATGPMRYDHSNGHLNGTKEKRERILKTYPMRVVCMLCDFDETHDSARLALMAQRKHLMEAHESEANRPKCVWRNPPNSFSLSDHRPHLSGG